MAWEMRKGDCMSQLGAMDSSSIDVIITDPPYDKKTHSGMRASGGTVQLGFDELATMGHVKEMLRVAKRWVIAFCSLEQLGEYQLYAGDSWVRSGFWDRVNGMPQLTGDRPAQPGEGIAIMHAGGGKKQWNGGGRPALWRCPRTNAEHHPTEKPVALMEMLLRDFTEYGETVLDPFAGSGSTGVAAVRLGRNFIGVEMLDKYHRIATMRLDGTKEQMQLTYQGRKKPKQQKLIGGDNGKEEGEEGTAVGDVEEKGSLSGDLLGVGRDQADAHREIEGGEGVPGGTVPELADRQREEGGPFDGQPEAEEESEPSEEFGGGW